MDVWSVLLVFFGLRSMPTVIWYLGLVAAKSYLPRHDSPNMLKAMVMFNLVVVVWNAYIVFLFHGGLEGESVFETEPTRSERLRQALDLYWKSKVFELMDTVFMILRDRTRQITFLHVYHHSSVVLLADFAAHVSPWPAITPVLFLNSLVHVIMYGYYAICAMGYRPPFKQLVTQAQMLQFCVLLAHCTAGYIWHGFCIYGILYTLSMLVLFGNFYRVAYSKQQKSKRLATKSD